MNPRRRFCPTPSQSRSHRLRYGVRTQAARRKKEEFFEEFLRLTDHPGPVPRDALPRRRRLPSPGLTTPAYKQSP
jgi:hypothetical protein